jgi:hypothetical protein
MDQDTILDRDKVVGVYLGRGSDHGRFVLQGPKGGFYLLSKNGTRKYLITGTNLIDFYIN